MQLENNRSEKNIYIYIYLYVLLVSNFIIKVFTRKFFSVHRFKSRGDSEHNSAAAEEQNNTF